MATRSPRRGACQSAIGNARPPARGAKPQPTEPAAPDEIAARAARLGITAERVLIEYARIAFADLRQIVEWGPEGILVKPPDDLSDADAASIAEIAAGPAGTHRVRLYDKKAALDAIARHLGMFPAAPRRREQDAPSEPAEDPREALARRLARLAAGNAAE